MNETARFYISISAGVLTLALLIMITVASPPEAQFLLPAVIFVLLILFTMLFSIPLVQGEVSLMPMTAIACYLVLGASLAGWTVFLGSVIHGGIRYRRSVRGTALHQSGSRISKNERLIGRSAVNATMHTIGVIIAGAAYGWIGGVAPLFEVTLADLLPLAALSLTYLGVNYVLAGIYIATLSKAALQSFCRSLPNVLLYEGGPLVFAPLMVLTFTRLGVVPFFFFTLLLITSSLIAYDLNVASRKLKRRIKELDSLQVVGRTLSASLDIETIVSALYTQVSRLMPTDEFYVALFNADMGEVSFPLAMENSERVYWSSRRMGNGLTEYVLNQQQSLLLRGDVKNQVLALGIDYIGRGAACWLGAPILAGDDVLGVIAVQSPSDPEAYDTSHQEILSTIAAQAAVAIQNARLYARTDETLARRVQELNSILRTTREGILLIDLDWYILSANRALADFLGVAQLELNARSLNETYVKDQSLIALVSYTEKALLSDCEALRAGHIQRKQEIVVLGPAAKYVERTLTPVRNRDDEIAGWLLVFRDIAEEIELARLKDDFTDMLVHDLRSPLTMIMGSLGLMNRAWLKQDMSEFDKLLSIARKSSERMLNLVNQLLDISKLESGQLPMQPERLDVELVLRETMARFAPSATESHITLEIAVSSRLPWVYADAQLLSRVLSNLLDNALKFTPDQGHVRLEARLDAESQALIVSVSDTGPGILPEDLPRLFEKFQQIDMVEGRRRGTGLGLAFCKLAVEAHSGRIWVDSVVGEGSTFILSLPIAS